MPHDESYIMPMRNQYHGLTLWFNTDNTDHIGSETYQWALYGCNCCYKKCSRVFFLQMFSMLLAEFDVVWSVYYSGFYLQQKCVLGSTE